MTRKSLVSLIALLTVVALVLAACGGDDDDADPTNTSPAAGGAPTTAATAGGGTAGGEGTAAGGEGTSTDGGGGDLVAQGEQLYNSLGCAGCHTTDGSESVGPSWQGIWGHEVELESGETVTVDEAYITQSIREPNSQIVAGFNPAMPPYGPDQVSDQDIQAIIAFIQSLSE